MGTVHLHRVLKAPPARVYKAFVDRDALIKWLPPYGFTGQMHAFEARVGAGYHMSFTNFGSGQSHSFRAKYVELKPNERIRYTDDFDSADLPGTMAVTVEFRAVLGGTELKVTQEGIPDVIPTEMCYLGWQESLLQLAQLVEPEIPNG